MAKKRDRVVHPNYFAHRNKTSCTVPIAEKEAEWEKISLSAWKTEEREEDV